MSITFPCPGCGQSYQVGERMAGKQVRCRKCESVMTVPADSPPPPTRRSPAPEPSRATRSPNQARPRSAPAPSPVPRARPSAAERTSNTDDLAWDIANSNDPWDALADVDEPPPLSLLGWRSSGSQKNSSANLKWSRTQTLWLGGAVAAIVILVMIGGTFLLRSGSSAYKMHQDASIRSIQTVERLAGQLGELQDAGAVDRVGPQVVESIQQLTGLAQSGASLPTLSERDADRLHQAYDARRADALNHLRTELARLREKPEFRPFLSLVLLTASQ